MRNHLLVDRHAGDDQRIAALPIRPVDGLEAVLARIEQRRVGFDRARLDVELPVLGIGIEDLVVHHHLLKKPSRFGPTSSLR
jgi:hypothetical protein